MIAVISAASAAAEVRLPSVIGDNMVLQCDQSMPVWGWAASGEGVTVAIGDNRATAKADESGKWMAHLAPMKASANPVEMTIAGSSGSAGWKGSGRSKIRWRRREWRSSKSLMRSRTMGW